MSFARSAKRDSVELRDPAELALAELQCQTVAALTALKEEVHRNLQNWKPLDARNVQKVNSNLEMRIAVLEESFKLPVVFQPHTASGVSARYNHKLVRRTEDSLSEENARAHC